MKGSRPPRHVEATLAMKEEALARTSPHGGKPARYKPGDIAVEHAIRPDPFMNHAGIRPADRAWG
ncbi:MAG: hypothetical protein OXN16_01610 [Gammaproteobacteria bacterium]|nr:hypothetical protein [Gammaproteobacteria bacterium]